MAKNGYTVTRSNYTLKEFHKNAPNGVIYERDFMTTSNLSGWKGGVFAHGENNFKMTFNNSPLSGRVHKYGDYLKHVEDGGESDTWTLSSGAEKGAAGSEGEIRIKTDNTTLLSYAYFGSCTELIKSTIKHIIENFPAEAYSTDEESFITYEQLGVACCIGVPKWYTFNNPFNIDFFTEGVNETTIENPMKSFQNSYMRYFVSINSEELGCVESVETICVNENFCGIDGTWDRIIEITANGQSAMIVRFIYNGQPYYITSRKNLSIRPSQEDIDAFFNSLDDFEKVLLNTESEPRYTATLDFPHETERGIETYKKRFTWPVSGNWNLDISSALYEEYLTDLLTLADFYDSYRTDNLWRMMTHDSIKNMDITFSRPDLDEDKDDYNEGTTKIQGLLWAYGRLFDELKRYIDNVRVTNKITYDEQGNLPDYFLSDTLGLSGWEVSSSVDTLDRAAVIPTMNGNGEYGTVDANVRFMNNLKLNTKEIFSRKGTRYGIEMILGLFGYHSDEFSGEGNGDYKVDEFISVATIKNGNGIVTHSKIYDNEGYENELSAEKYGAKRSNTETDLPDGAPSDALDGLPVSIFYYTRYAYKEIVANSIYSDAVTMNSVPQSPSKSDPALIKVGNKYYQKVEDGWKTIVPWFEQAEDMDGNPYFQMFGGWGKIQDGEYSETLNYLSVSDTIGGLVKISIGNVHGEKNGTICYVSDVSDFSEYFPNVAETNYFVLTNAEYIDTIGGDGWKPVTDAQTKTHIEYLEKIIDEYRGNNPHVGYDNYDDGEEFFEYIKKIFKGSIEDGVFSDDVYDCNNGEIISAVTAQGFNIQTAVDNKKCWYFYDKAEYNLDNQAMQELILKEDGYNYDAQEMSYVDGFSKDGVSPIDVRGNYGGEMGNNTVYAEPSVVNRKNLVVTFRTGNETEQNYIKKTVMPYLTQVVPSTSILEIKFEN